MQRLHRLLNHRRAPWILGLALSILALLQAQHRAGQGRCALFKWDSAFEAFFSAGELYSIGAEGYPTLPFSLILMAPFHAAGPYVGACLWALFKVGLAWWIVTRALRMLEGRLAPAWTLLVIVISLRPLLSDITHGNINLVVGASVATAAWSWFQGQEFRTGFWFGVGTILKVTPALGLLWLLRKKSWRGLSGMTCGLLFALTLPALFVGWTRNVHYMNGWWSQMVEPYLQSRTLTLMQTEHINQSLFGVLARYVTDSVAIPDITSGMGNIRIHFASLSAGAFHRLHQALSALLLGSLLWRSAGRERAGTLAQFSMLALAMLFLSERSWKHHYVLLVFPVAFLVAHATCNPKALQRHAAALTVALAMLLFGCTGSGLLGDHGSNLAEAYGAYFLGGLALFVATAWLARHPLPPASVPVDPVEPRT
ncbi:MAG: alpha-1,2-mannosyltransferase [Candidatus Paceibacteria bacterium]|jgi:alpha-1,2-mannosyltransferase